MYQLALEIVFWFAAILIVYIYIGYPLAIYCWAICFPAKINRDAFEPSVTLLIPAYNEAAVIAKTIENKLALDYPKDKLEIIVMSDESDDGTDDIVRQYSDRGVRLMRQVPRRGKTSALNMAVPEATGDILVFSDANSIYAEDALRAIVANFADEQVGYVTGKMLYTNPDGSLIGDGCSAYMKYENALRQYESAAGSIVGVDGGIDATRRSLYQPMRDDQLPDFVQPLSVVERGYRVVYEPNAVLKEEALSGTSSEYSMRVRVALRAMWAMYDMRSLFNIKRFPLFAWQFISHKLLRYSAFAPLAIALLSNVLLAPYSGFYTFLLLVQCIFYSLALAGYFKDEDQDNPVYFALPYYFVLLNIASLHAAIRFCKREKQVIWKPRVG